MENTWSVKPLASLLPIIRIGLPVSLILLLWLCGADAAEPDFNREIRPILADHCYECHGPDEASRKGDLRLDQLEESVTWAITPGEGKQSLIIERMQSHDPELKMPPPESKRQPKPHHIEKLIRWIDAGANYKNHWAFTPLVRPVLPVVAETKWPRNEIDHFVLAHLEQQQLAPQKDADPEILARRLSLALTGLPLLPEQINLFAAHYREHPEQAVSDLVDQLLEKPAYGEHLAWFWMDAARYADTNGFQADDYRIMWPWRDWLIRNLNENLPYDNLTRQMLAGDLMIPPAEQEWESADWIVDASTSDLITATGFLRNHRYDTGSGTNPAESHFENSCDRLETVGTVWMGLTLQCARCHSHKYDPIENREYYQLLAYFDKVPEFGSALRAASHPYIHAPNDHQRKELQSLSHEVEDKQACYNQAKIELINEQLTWENQLTSSESVQRVQWGLKFQYAVEEYLLDGQTTQTEPNAPIAMCAGNKQWTISFWFQPDTLQNGAIFSSVEEPDRYRPGIQVDLIDGKIRLRHVCRWLNSYIEFVSKKLVKSGKWYHITFSCDGRMQGLAYSASLNGSTEKMHCTHSVTNDSAGGSGKAPLLLGGSPLLPGAIGILKDLRFYDRRLQQIEIYSLAEARSTADLVQIPLTERDETIQLIIQEAFWESSQLPAAAQRIQQDYFEAQQKLFSAVRATSTVMVMQDRRTEKTRIRKAGVFDSLGPEVQADTPQFLSGSGAGPTQINNRLDLAEWLLRPEHPLTSRVAVNRIWQMLWGHGFVDSPENFGTQTAAPLHADLLDWLANEYIRLGWDTKSLIKLIATSRAYRQSSAAASSNWQRDPRNHNLARGPRFRLPISVIRDQALFLSGRLDATLGGPPVVLDVVLGKDARKMKLPFAQADNRRTLYTFWKRNSPHPLLTVYDVADRNHCDVRARRTNTPLQSLVTLNEPGFVESARELGKRACEHSGTEAEQLGWLWQACTGRVAEAEQKDLLVLTLNSYRKTAATEQDAWMAMANVLLNLDVTLTLE